VLGLHNCVSNSKTAKIFKDPRESWRYLLIAEEVKAYVHERRQRTALTHHLLQFCVQTRIPQDLLQLQNRASGSLFWKREASQKTDECAAPFSMSMSCYNY